jgi:enterochelin esterase-like enzyme
VAQQAAAGHLAPAVVVMPFYTPGQIDTECVDGGAGQPQVEQWLTRDVTGWVEHHLRVGNSRTSWATFGLSAGAWCASMLAMLHPDLYSAAISLGGYYQPDFARTYIPFKPGSPQWDHYDLLRVAHDHPPTVALWVQTSKADAVSYGTTRQLLATAKPPTSITADVLPNAGHRLSVWTALIPQTLQWLGRTAPGFTPAPVLRLPGWVSTGSAAPAPPDHRH